MSEGTNAFGLYKCTVPLCEPVGSDLRIGLDRAKNSLQIAGEGAEGHLSWYALYVRSNCESLVQDRLNAGTEAQAYWPSYPVERTLRGKKFTIQRSLFPGYVFARFDLEHRKQLVTLPQIVHILGSDGPLAIPDTEVEAVRKLTLAPQSAVVQPWQYVEAGDEVEIVKGPHSMRGLRGFVVYHKSQLRVVVSVRMLQRSIATEVEASWLRAVKQ